MMTLDEMRTRALDLSDKEISPGYLISELWLIAAEICQRLEFVNDSIQDQDTFNPK